MEKHMITQAEVQDIFDYNNGALFWKKTLSNRIKIGSRAGVSNGNGYIRVGIKGKRYYCPHCKGKVNEISH